jgi:DNA-binding NtrC family response regulator
MTFLTVRINPGIVTHVDASTATMSRTKPLVLIADDNDGLRSLLERFALQQGFDVIGFPDGAPALASLRTNHPDIALVDLQMPEIGGLEVLRAMRDAVPECRVVLMTAQPSVESAIQAVKLGALDYLSKPFEFDRVREVLATVTQGLQQRQAVFEAESKLAARVEYCGMIGRSSVMQELFDTIRRLAPHVRTALISGETGTGKELVARALHHSGPRRTRQFISFNCSAVVETLFESEFFGHTRGAFTGATDAKAGLFEQADGGTLFLDEIGELPLPMQAKLLRVVEYGELQRVGSSSAQKINVHVVAATNRELSEEVRAKRFREDLYYRLNVAEIRLPALRERRDDICLLVASFVKEFATRFQKPLAGLTPQAERLLQQAQWPGNVRELRTDACSANATLRLRWAPPRARVRPSPRALPPAFAAPRRPLLHKMTSRKRCEKWPVTGPLPPSGSASVAAPFTADSNRSAFNRLGRKTRRHSVRAQAHTLCAHICRQHPFRKSFIHSRLRDRPGWPGIRS